MSRGSISAYELMERVAAYDADTELMHPNRSNTVETALQVLPFEPHERLTAVDLGVGSGYFTGRFLEAHPQSKVYGIDGALTMIELARARLGDLAKSVDLRVGGFRSLGAACRGREYRPRVLIVRPAPSQA